MNKKSLIKKIALVLLSVCVIVAVSLLDPNVDKLDEALMQVKPVWLISALFAALTAYLGDTLIYAGTCRLMGIPQKFFYCLSNTMIGFFYNALTPFQSGGQPMQIINMHKRSIPIGTGTSVFMVKFIAWQTANVLVSTAALIVLGLTPAGNTFGAKLMLLLGYGVNVALLCVVAASLLFPSKISNWGCRFLAFLYRHKLIRKKERYENWTDTWVRTVADYKSAARFVLKNLGKTLPLFLYGLLEVSGYMLVTYFIYRGFGLNEYSLFHVVLTQSLLSIAVSFIPLPGASVASEGGFYLVFGTLFGDVLRFPAMLAWRLFTYYLNIVLGLVFVLIDGFTAKKVQSYAMPQNKDSDGGEAPESE